MTPMYNTKFFINIYDDVNKFLADYNNNGLPAKIKQESASTLYYLLYAKYGNNPIANYDENQFKYKLFSIIWQYGPAWERRLEIQDRLRGLSESELLTGQKLIMNTSLNPDQQPSNEEVNYINQQNTNKSTKSILGAYAEIWDLLKLDVTQTFINQFKDLFKIVVMPELPLLYLTEDEE